MMQPDRGEYSALQKIPVKCNSCGVSESFYSNLSVEHFRASHRGHDVLVGGEGGTTSGPQEVKAALRQETPPDGQTGTKLSKVMVDMANFPALRDPVFRVRGLKDDMEEAFVTTLRFDNRTRVRQLLASCEYADDDLDGARYFWEPAAIEYDEDARDFLGFSAGAAAPEPESDQGLERLEDSAMAGASGASSSLPSRAESAETSVEPSTTPSAQATVADKLAEVQLGCSPQESAQEQQLDLERRDAPAAVQPAPAHAEAQSSPLASPDDEDAHLLVSKSWYIQGGEGNKKEAARISKVLKAFRWKVEPLYTIGVILDDILSIEPSKNQISRALITRVEGAGYRLTAVTIDQGRPMAWFKKAVPVAEGGEGPDQLAKERSTPEYEADGSGADVEADVVG